MDTSAGHICQCCGGIKSEGGETIAVKSELVEIKKEISGDDQKRTTEIKRESDAETTQNIDSGDIENKINVSLDEKMKTEESDIDTKSWKRIAEKPEGGVITEENEDKQNAVCNTCGGIVVKTEKNTDTKLMIPLLGTLHITPTSRDLGLEVGIDNSEVNQSTEQGPDAAIKDAGVAVSGITPIMQDQVEPIVIQPESMASDNECHEEQPDQQTYTVSKSNAADTENDGETFKPSIICAITGGMKVKDTAKIIMASTVAQQLGTEKPNGTKKVGPTRKSPRIVKSQSKEREWCKTSKNRCRTGVVKCALPFLPGPTMRPTVAPVNRPVVTPANRPAVTPVNRPTVSPVNRPTVSPVNRPVVTPANRPAVTPVNRPTVSPVNRPTVSPVNRPTVTPANRPAVTPVNRPTVSPVNRPTMASMNRPTVARANRPTVTQVNRPAVTPTNIQTVTTANRPTVAPANRPVVTPANRPAVTPANRPTVTPANRPTTNTVNRPTRTPGNIARATHVNRLEKDISKSLSRKETILHCACFQKRCVYACLAYEELKKHCADEHDYVGSMKCGRCHEDLTCQELYQNHVAYCRAPFQCIDCGQTFAKHNSFVYHVKLPWCAMLPDYKLLYQQVPKNVSYSFSEPPAVPKKSRSHGKPRSEDPMRYRLVMKKKRSGYAPPRNANYRKVQGMSVKIMKKLCVKETIETENRIYF